MIRETLRKYARAGIPCLTRSFTPGRQTGAARPPAYRFQVLHGGRLYAFEAVVCCGNRWRREPFRDGQLRALRAVERHGGRAFYLVLFTRTGRLVRMPIDVVADPGRRSFSPRDGQTVKADFLGIFEERAS